VPQHLLVDAVVLPPQIVAFKTGFSTGSPQSAVTTGLLCAARMTSMSRYHRTENAGFATLPRIRHFTMKAVSRAVSEAGGWLLRCTSATDVPRAARFRRWFRHTTCSFPG